LPAEFMNMLMMENLNVLSAAGITPAKGQYSQLSLAIAKIVKEGAAVMAGETVAGVLKLSTTAQVSAGTDDATAITPLKLAQKLANYLGQATETVFGWMKISTQAQINAGTDDATAITPKKLASWFSTTFGQATETVSGIAKIATQAQMIAGTDDSTIVTPKKLAAWMDPWAMQPIGVPIPLFNNLAGAAIPSSTKEYRYITLTASDPYNAGVLVNETVSGSFPLVVASAVISLAGSPMNGQTVSLINTEQRLLRGSMVPGQLLQDALQSITGSMSYASVNGATGAFAFNRVGQGATYDGANAVGTVTFDASLVARTAAETRAKSVGVVYFMRIK